MINVLEEMMVKNNSYLSIWKSLMLLHYQKVRQALARKDSSKI